MPRPLILTRSEAEYLVDLLEGNDHPYAKSLNDDLRQLYGMGPRQGRTEEERERVESDYEWAKPVREACRNLSIW